MARFETIEEYLAYIGQQRGSSFGKRYRQQFRDSRGTAELAMLAAPSEAEYEDFCRAVAAMSDEEKQETEQLTDQQVNEIARRSGADSGNIGIFVNGYVLARRDATGT